MERIIIRINETILKQPDSVACLGFFDGVHKGHQMLLNQTMKQAKQHNMKSACVTLDTDPWIVLKGDTGLKNLTTLSKRLDIIESMGIEVCYILHFDLLMAQASKDTFIQLLKDLNIKEIICGSDYRYGHKNSGDVEYLKQFIPTIVTPMFEMNGKKVSSSTIEQDIRQGDFTSANACLGYDYEVTGHVIKGRQVGRELGFPTANVKVDGNYVMPKQGVYAGKMKVNGTWYLAMISLGYNLTLNTRDHLSLEAHLLNFSEDIYGVHITLSFFSHLRDEMKFNSKEELIEQMQQDKKDVEGLADEINPV